MITSDIVKHYQDFCFICKEKIKEKSWIKIREDTGIFYIESFLYSNELKIYSIHKDCFEISSGGLLCFSSIYLDYKICCVCELKLKYMNNIQIHDCSTNSLVSFCLEHARECLGEEFLFAP